MATLTIEIPDKVEKTLVDLIELLGGRVVATDIGRELVKAIKDNQVLENSKQSIKEIKKKSSKPGMDLDLEAIVFMKFGYHAKEDKSDIIERKRAEFAKTGKIFWGYGGTICHPINQVQQFVKQLHLKGKKVFLAMSFTKSKPGMENKASMQFSTDNLSWNTVPDGIMVTGSKYAIVCSELLDCDITLNLNNYNVAIGASIDKKASEYIKYRIDKGCLIRKNDQQLNPYEFKVELLAEIVEPYAVFMR